MNERKKGCFQLERKQRFHLTLYKDSAGQLLRNCIPA